MILVPSFSHFLYVVRFHKSGAWGYVLFLCPLSITEHHVSEVHPGSCAYSWSILCCCWITVPSSDCTVGHSLILFSLSIPLGSSLGLFMNEASVYSLIHILMKLNIYLCWLYSHWVELLGGGHSHETSKWYVRKFDIKNHTSQQSL